MRGGGLGGGEIDEEVGVELVRGQHLVDDALALRGIPCDGVELLAIDILESGGVGDLVEE
jgi:hypothetical protein